MNFLPLTDYVILGSHWLLFKKWCSWNFPDDLEPKTPFSQCRVNPSSGDWIPHAETKTWRGQINILKNNNNLKINKKDVLHDSFQIFKTSFIYF